MAAGLRGLVDADPRSFSEASGTLLDFIAAPGWFVVVDLELNGPIRDVGHYDLAASNESNRSTNGSLRGDLAIGQL